jgi:hypothetical protein
MKTRTTLIVAGALTMAYAAGGALADPEVALTGVLLFLAGVLIAHDAVWMPVVLVAAAALNRIVPPRHRAAARIAAITAAAVTVVALPLVLGFGRPADNPSALPLPYGRNLAVVLLVIAGSTVLTRLWRRRSPGRKETERPAAADAGPAGG